MAVTGNKPTSTKPPGSGSAWPALWALVVGFFMIMVDTTIVAVATPTIMRDLNADVTKVVWVTSSYLLAYAVPLLITGRLGDRIGPKWVYLIGLATFTLSSLWCGLSGNIEMLITARVFQGLGAAMMVPQTMAVITRTFPPERRGKAMSLWGAVAGVATMAGPLLGGVLIDAIGWEWIFFINVPVGAAGFVIALRLVPELEIHSHRFDLLGVVLSAVSMFGIVFGIQEGSNYDWDYRSWLLIGGGIIAMAVFLGWQRWGSKEPLVPLGLFRDRNFSLSNVAITATGFLMIAFALPAMLYAQTVLGLDPTHAAMLTIPQSVIGIILAPIVGKLVDTQHPRYLAGFGLLTASAAVFWLSRIIGADTPIWQLLLPIGVLGIGVAFIFSPLGASANRNLPMSRAGAGSGVFNTSRQVGAVLGSAAIAALMSSRLAADLPPMPGGSNQPTEAGVAQLPPQLAEGFAQAMGESLLLPAAVILVGFGAGAFLVLPKHLAAKAAPSGAEQTEREPATADQD